MDLILQTKYCDSEKSLNEFLSTLSVDGSFYPKLANIQYVVNPTAEGNDNNFRMENSVIAIVSYLVEVNHDKN